MPNNYLALKIHQYLIKATELRAFVKINPQEFLTLALPFGVLRGPQISQEKLKNLENVDPDKWQPPMLSIKQNNNGSYQVGIHDGRHRALVALQKKKTLIKVQIARGQKFAREYPTISDHQLLQRVIVYGSLISEDGSKIISTKHWKMV